MHWEVDVMRKLWVNAKHFLLQTTWLIQKDGKSQDVLKPTRCRHQCNILTQMEVIILNQALQLIIAAKWEDSTQLMDNHILKSSTHILKIQDQLAGKNSSTRKFMIRDVQSLMKNVVDLLTLTHLKCLDCILIGILFPSHLKSTTLQNAVTKQTDTINVCQTWESVMIRLTTNATMNQQLFGLKLVETHCIQWMKLKDKIVLTPFGRILVFGWLQPLRVRCMLTLKNMLQIQSISLTVLALYNLILITLMILDKNQSTTWLVRMKLMLVQQILIIMLMKILTTTIQNAHSLMRILSNRTRIDSYSIKSMKVTTFITEH